jgi:hypothetical protein
VKTTVSNQTIAKILGWCRMPSYALPENTEDNNLLNLVVRAMIYGDAFESLREICDVLAASSWSTAATVFGDTPLGEHSALFYLFTEDGTVLELHNAHDSRTRARVLAQRYLQAWKNGDLDTLESLITGHGSESVSMAFELCNFLYAINMVAAQPAGTIIGDAEFVAVVVGDQQYTAPAISPTVLISMLIIKHEVVAVRHLAAVVAGEICGLLGAGELKAQHGKVKMQLFDANAIAVSPGHPHDPGLAVCIAAQEYLTAWLQDDELTMRRMTAAAGPDAMMLLNGLCLVLQGLHLGQKAAQKWTGEFPAGGA